MEANNVNAIANETDENETSRLEAYRALVKSEAIAASEKKGEKVSQTDIQIHAMLGVKARRTNVKVADLISAFDAEFPKKTRSEWDSKLAELDQAVIDARETGKESLIKFALSTREKEIKRHDAQIVNAKKAADSRKSKKASEVVTTMLYDNAPEYAIA